MNDRKNPRRYKRRIKSSVVRDPNGSSKTFFEFYQRGGRDYEQYRLWLQTLSDPAADSDKIKIEPMENTIDVANRSPLAPRIASTHPLLKPMRHFSSPIKSSVDWQIPPSNTSMSDWSVTDVGGFIEKHISEKSIARKFMQQKIDGRTLPLLTEDHLTRIFKMKLGPALRLLTLISSMSE